MATTRGSRATGADGSAHAPGTTRTGTTRLRGTAGGARARSTAGGATRSATGTRRAAHTRRTARATATAALALALLAATAACDDEDHRAANEKRVAHACRGLLPAAGLRPVLPRESTVTTREFGTSLTPDRASRALLDCTVSWEPDRKPFGTSGIRLRAEAAPGRIPRFSKDLDDQTEPRPAHAAFGLPLPSDAEGAVTVDSDGRVVASLTLSCPGGLTGRTRPLHDLHIGLDFPQTDETDYRPTAAERRTASRTAVRVADRITAQQHCGTRPLAGRPAPDKAERARGAALCSWLDAKKLRLDGGASPDAWRPDGDTRYSRRTAHCSAGTDEPGIRDRDRPGLAHVTADSWSGVHARTAYEDHADKGAVPGARDRPDFPEPGDEDIPESAGGDDGPELALWARSVCDGGRTYHRVAAGLGTPDPAPGHLTKEERAQLSADVRRTLDRYLDARAGWPRQSHCHDTELLGEAQDWAPADRRKETPR